MADLSVIPGRELQLAGPESITHVPAKAGNRFRIMDSGLAARSQSPLPRGQGLRRLRKHDAAAPRNDKGEGSRPSVLIFQRQRLISGLDDVQRSRTTRRTRQLPER